MTDQVNLWDELGFTRLELERLSSPIRKTLDNYSTFMERIRRADARRESHLPDLPGTRPLPFSEFGFVNSWRTNAYVDGLRNESLVTFTAAMPFAIRDWFDYVLFDNRVLRGHNVPDPRLGRSDEIEKPPQTYEFLSASIESERATHDSSVRLTSYSFKDYRPPSQRTGIGRFQDHPPMDFEHNVVNREMLSEQLASIAANFLLFHEIAHVTRGHLRYRIAELNTTRFAEMSASDESPADDPITLQALEVDADLHSAMRVLAPLKPADDPLLRHIQAKIPIDFQVHRHVFALGILFMLLQRKAPAPGEYVVASHPPHRLRFDLVCRIALSFKEHFEGSERTLLEKGIARALVDLETCAELLDASSIVTSPEDAALRAHQRTLLDRLTTVTPALQNHIPNIQEIGDALLYRRETSIVEDPNVTPAQKLDSLVRRADVLWSRGDLQAAILDYRAATQITGLRPRESAFAHARLANALAAAGNNEEALASIARALEYNEAEVASRVLTKRAEIYEKQGQVEQAEAEFELAINYKGSRNDYWPSEQALARLARARFFSRHEKYDQALSDLILCGESSGGTAAFFVDVQFEIATLAYKRNRLLPAIWHFTNVYNIEKIVEKGLRVEGTQRRWATRALIARATLRYSRRQFSIARMELQNLLADNKIDPTDRAAAKELQSQIFDATAESSAQHRSVLHFIMFRVNQAAKDCSDIAAERRALFLFYGMRKKLKRALKYKGIG